MSQFVQPGHYKLLSAVIRTFAGKEIDIVSLIPIFLIEESLDNDSIRGSAMIYDNIGFMENLPIRAEETITFTIEDALKQKLTYEMAIYKITDVQVKNTNDGLTYNLHFVSKSRFDASFRRIIEPHDDKISNIAESIFERYYTTGTKGLILEDTIGLFRCVIPNYTPMQALNFLSRRAYSTGSPSCSFRFFETSESYYFVSDEFLIKRFLDDKTLIKEFTFSDALSKSGSDFMNEMKNIIEIKNTDRVNTMTDLVSGAYRSNVIEIDLIKKQVTLPGKSNKHEFDYQKAKKKFISVSGKGIDQDVHSEAFVNEYFTQENERRYIVIRDYDDSGTLQLRGDQFLPQIVTNRISYRQHLNNTIVFAKTHGRLDLNAGNIINLKIPEFTASKNRKLNPQLSGYYMINDLTHTFDKDVHSTSLKLIKYDWSTIE